MNKIRIIFQSFGVVEAEYDKELELFLSELKKNSNRPEDVRILTTYFNLMWPHISNVSSNGTYNVPDLYLNFEVYKNAKRKNYQNTA